MYCFALEIKFLNNISFGGGNLFSPAVLNNPNCHSFDQFTMISEYSVCLHNTFG